MGKNFEKILQTALAGTIMWSSIVYSKEEPHMPQEKPTYVDNSSFNKYNFVVSGEKMVNKLPDNIEEIGPSHLNPNEKLYGVVVPISEND